MARGRQGSERFYRSTSVRRAASVPVGMGGDPSLSNLIKAQNISSGAMDDSGAISSASRWRDQQLLNNITNTLHNRPSGSVQPGMDVSLQSGYRRHINSPKFPPSEPEVRDRLRVSMLTEDSGRGRRCQSVEPTYKMYDSEPKVRPTWRNDRISAEILNRARESLSDRRIVDKVGSSSSADIVSNIFSVAGARGPSLNKKADETSEYVASILKSAEDRAKRAEAPAVVVTTEAGAFDDEDTFYYGDPLASRETSELPYVSTLYDDRDRDDEVEVIYVDRYGHSVLPSKVMWAGCSDALKSSPRSSSLTSVPRRPFVPRGITSSGLAVRQARQSLGRLERELGVDEGGSPYSYYDDSYAIEAPIASPIVVPTRVTSVRRASLPAIHQRYSVTGMPSVPLRSTVPPSPALSTAHSKLASIESMLDTTYEPPIQPASYTTLRSAAVEARNKMDRNKKMLDKYLPVHLGPENEVEYEVDYRYGQLADRMPQLSPYKPKSVAVTNSLVAPYRPVAKAGRDLCEVAKPPMISGRPPISDTRKRCREVLCKVKGDPRYYD